MKLIKDSINIYLPQAKLYLDDLEKIDKILKENSLTYTMNLDEYELESINEISSIKDKQEFTKLSILSMKPRLYLDLSTSLTARTWISCDDDYTLLGIVEKIKPIIKKRKNNWHLFSRIEGFLPIFLGIINVWIYFEIKNSFLEIFLNIMICLCIAKSFFIKEAVVFTSMKYTERTSYFTRNKDQIITSLLSGSIGLIAGIVLTFLKVRLDSAH